MELSKIALENRERTAEDSRSAAVSRGMIEPDVFSSSIYRVLHKTGLHHGRLEWTDPRQTTDPLIAWERKEFRFHQRTDPLFKAEKLLFFDECDVGSGSRLARAGISRGPWSGGDPSTPIDHGGFPLPLLACSHVHGR